MHDAITHSCNAYFAQLALRLGPEAILDTAAHLGISVAAPNSVQRLRATLPQAGYGQGDVVATPLRMARVAAALASGGVLREPRWEARTADPQKTDILVPPDAAAILAGYMRDAVLHGTGRSLSGHPWRIAGKTGTAEVSGSPSHAWFVGFAPYGPATRRIAVVVIIENARMGAGRAVAGYRRRQWPPGLSFEWSDVDILGKARRLESGSRGPSTKRRSGSRTPARASRRRLLHAMVVTRSSRRCSRQDEARTCFPSTGSS